MSSEIASRRQRSRIAATRRGERAARAFAACAITLALASPSQAGPSSPADKAMAEALFRDGKLLLDAGKLTEACGKLEESQRIDPKLGTLLNLATCHQEQGRTASAWAEFNEAASMATVAKQNARVNFAKVHANDLEQRLSRLTIKIDNPEANLAIKINGKDLSVAAIGSSIPVDPGNLSITVTAPGKKPWSQTIPIEPGPAAKDLHIPDLEAEAPPSQPAPEPPPPPPPPPRHIKTGIEATGQQIAGIAIAGVGLVGVGVGSYFGIRTLQKSHEIRSLCDNTTGDVCDKGRNTSREAHTSATTSNVSFIAGLTCLAGGALLFFTAPSGKPMKSALRIVPMVSPEGIVVTLGGSL